METSLLAISVSKFGWVPLEIRNNIKTACIRLLKCVLLILHNLISWKYIFFWCFRDGQQSEHSSNNYYIHMQKTLAARPGQPCKSTALGHNGRVGGTTIIQVSAGHSGARGTGIGCFSLVHCCAPSRGAHLDNVFTLHSYKPRQPHSLTCDSHSRQQQHTTVSSGNSYDNTDTAFRSPASSCDLRARLPFDRPPRPRLARNLSSPLTQHSTTQHNTTQRSAQSLNGSVTHGFPTTPLR